MQSVHARLAEFGSELLNKKSIGEGLPYISLNAKDIVGADRCSIFIYDLINKELWTTIADGESKIIIPSYKGIVGQTILLQKSIIVNDPEANPHFNSKVDKDTGYTTKNIITEPIFNSEREIVGVLQLLNKVGGFSEKDTKYMKFFTHYVGGFLELVTLYGDDDSASRSTI